MREGNPGSDITTPLPPVRNIVVTWCL